MTRTANIASAKSVASSERSIIRVTRSCSVTGELIDPRRYPPPNTFTCGREDMRPNHHPPGNAGPHYVYSPGAYLAKQPPLVGANWMRALIFIAAVVAGVLHAKGLI